MSLELGGEKRGVPFKMGTLRKLKELTNSDPYGFLSALNINDIDDQAKFVSTIVYAALLANAQAKKEVPDFSKEDVELWVDDLDMSDWTEVISTFVKAYVGEPSGEEGADTRQEAANVAIDA